MQLIPSPKKCLFWSTMKPLGMKHDKTGITNRMRWLTQLCFYRIREKGMGLLGPRKKRGNMELVEKKSDQSREALYCRSRSPIACMWKSCSLPFPHTHRHAHTHTHTRVLTHIYSSCDSFLASWLLSFISPVAVNVSYAIGEVFFFSPKWILSLMKNVTRQMTSPPSLTHDARVCQLEGKKMISKSFVRHGDEKFLKGWRPASCCIWEISRCLI